MSTATLKKKPFSLGALTGGSSSPLAIGIVAVAAVLLIFGAVTTENFLTVFNIKVILRSAAFVGIFAIGLTFVTISGNFFLLSLEETAAMSSIAFATFISSGWGLLPSLWASAATPLW